MKNVIMMLWGMGLASAWWGLGLELYHNGVTKEVGGLGLALAFTFVFSLATAVYSLFKMVSCIHRSWND